MLTRTGSKQRSDDRTTNLSRLIMIGNMRIDLFVCWKNVWWRNQEILSVDSVWSVWEIGPITPPAPATTARPAQPSSSTTPPRAPPGGWPGDGAAAHGRGAGGRASVGLRPHLGFTDVPTMIHFARSLAHHTNKKTKNRPPPGDLQYRRPVARPVIQRTSQLLRIVNNDLAARFKFFLFVWNKAQALVYVVFSVTRVLVILINNTLI